MIQVLVFTTMITIISLLFSLKETAASMAKSGCPETCGNVSIVYPFGIGKGCYLDKRFEITCNNSSLPHPIFHLGEENEAEVLHVSGVYENQRLDFPCLLCELHIRRTKLCPVLNCADGAFQLFPH